jgi:MOSC domain-containing protein YiiM
MNHPIAKGKVEHLAINGKPVTEVMFDLNGPVGDIHSGFERKLSGHDNVYIATSNLKKGAPVFNWRTWTGLSWEELAEIEEALDHKIPEGCLLENITFSGIPNFSKLEPGSRLVLPYYNEGGITTQAILAIWEENAPCATGRQKT